MKTNLSNQSIERVFKAALAKGLIHREDTAMIFNDLTFLKERILHLKSVFPSHTLHGIAMKANPLISILALCKPLDMGVEVASKGELFIAMKSGYPPDKIIFDSPVKTYNDLEYALNAGVHINADSFDEVKRIGHLLEKSGSSSTIGIRINPQVGTGKILESSVAGEYSKFGVPMKQHREELIQTFRENSWLTGVHLHVGSQGCSMDLLIEGIRVVYDFVKKVNGLTGRRQINLFDIGGGLPVSYDSKTIPVSIEEYAGTIHKNFPELFEEDKWKLMTEFGRWVHVNTGWTMSRVEYVKHESGISTAMIHTGADLFVRECLNPKDWQHEYSVLDKEGNLKTGEDINLYNLAGPLCFSGDILARNVKLPHIEEGDFVIIHDTGGYTFSMWSRYNSRQTPGITGYFNEGEEFIMVKERESLEDVFKFWT
ncbi:MAG: diaminopimelate decarboxylase [Bacteroidetes bacterium]|nr:diaminopimelate decarboxylase [Bacteroidota bacterium]